MSISTGERRGEAWGILLQNTQRHPNYLPLLGGRLDRGEGEHQPFDGRKGTDDGGLGVKLAEA